jgi:DNA-directed RNA polymerase subunit RPC12/RpoP
MEATPKVKCPKCGSEDISANKKGFSAGKAVGGALLTGGIGLAAGAIGSGKVILTCLFCGHQFKPGDAKKDLQKKESHPKPASEITSGGFIVLVLFIIIILLILSKIF